MKRYEDPAWKKAMTIRYDFSNMTDSRIDVSAQAKKFQKDVGTLTQDDISDIMPSVRKAMSSLRNKAGRTSRMMAWTRLPTAQKTVVTDILRTAERVRGTFDDFVVLGIGGSALGPIAVQQALSHPFYNLLSREARGGPRFFVEDNVDPGRMRALFDVVDVRRACFNVVTKSGGTPETMSQFLIVRDMLEIALGERWNRHVIATTDQREGSLARIAKEDSIKAFAIPKGVGGRFSELSPVGLLPAAVCGVDIEEMLAGAAWMSELCQEEDPMRNPAWMSAAVMFIAMTRKGKVIQVMMPYSDALRYMSDWYAQLWAESLGKRTTLRGRIVHTGQTPVKAVGVTDQHSQMQLYTQGPFDKAVTLLGVDRYSAEAVIPDGYPGLPDVNFLCGHTLNELMSAERSATEYALLKAGRLNQSVTLPEVNAFTVGQLIYFFEMQTAAAGELLGIDAYDQPGVEEGKQAAFALLGKPGYEGKRAELTARPGMSGGFRI